MVALAIMAVSIVAVFQLFSIALRSTKKAEDTSRAILYARTFMDEAYLVSDPAEISGSKEFESYFRVSREAVVKSVSKDKKARLYEIVVTVTWPPSGRLILNGLRSINAPEE
jgi:type II secretory pathway pseudopilin PulG